MSLSRFEVVVSLQLPDGAMKSHCVLFVYFVLFFVYLAFSLILRMEVMTFKVPKNASSNGQLLPFSLGNKSKILFEVLTSRPIPLDAVSTELLTPSVEKVPALITESSPNLFLFFLLAKFSMYKKQKH